MVKELINIEMERDSLQQKWGFTVQGGKDVSLTAKIASVKVRKGRAITDTESGARNMIHLILVESLVFNPFLLLSRCFISTTLNSIFV